VAGQTRPRELPRRLAALPEIELREAWEEFARLAILKVDPISGRLPSHYAAVYARFHREFRRRGEQLSLF
jgi:hypothetical protein